MERTGGCACGAVRFRITLPLQGVGACHCTHCQQASGGGASYTVLVPLGGLELTDGEPKCYSRTGGSGGTAHRYFCGACGTPLYSRSDNVPFIPVRIGALDDQTGLKPMMHIFASSAPEWHNIPKNAAAFDGMPPMPS